MSEVAGLSHLDWVWTKPLTKEQRGEIEAAAKWLARLKKRRAMKGK